MKLVKLNNLKHNIFLILFCLLLNDYLIIAQSKNDLNLSGFRLGRVKYSGGGDWYNDPSADENVLKFLKESTNINIKTEYEYVDLATDEIFKYPMLFMTGHGNINFSANESERLKKYLDAGGFLYIDDDYGFDEYIRKEMKKVYPDKKFEELPPSHKIFNIHYNLKNGMPKTHEHDDKPPQIFALYNNDKISVIYTYESNPSDGWADPDIHKDSPEKRLEALQFGANLIIYALTR